MREIPLTKGYVAIVDDCDYDRVSSHKWCANLTKCTVYARAYIEGKYMYMHRCILNAPKGMEVDHIDHNGLNNVRTNLRLVTRSQNNQNRRTYKNSTTGSTGVCWYANRRKWRAHVAMDGKRYYVGYFTTIEEAEEAVAKKRLELHKEFACDK